MYARQISHVKALKADVAHLQRENRELRDELRDVQAELEAHQSSPSPSAGITLSGLLQAGRHTLQALSGRPRASERAPYVPASDSMPDSLQPAAPAAAATPVNVESAHVAYAESAHVGDDESAHVASGESAHVADVESAHVAEAEFEEAAGDDDGESTGDSSGELDLGGTGTTLTEREIFGGSDDEPVDFRGELEEEDDAMSAAGEMREAARFGMDVLAAVEQSGTDEEDDGMSESSQGDPLVPVENLVDTLLVMNNADLQRYVAGHAGALPDTFSEILENGGGHGCSDLKKVLRILKVSEFVVLDPLKVVWEDSGIPNTDLRASLEACRASQKGVLTFQTGFVECVEDFHGEEYSEDLLKDAGEKYLLLTTFKNLDCARKKTAAELRARPLPELLEVDMADDSELPRLRQPSSRVAALRRTFDPKGR
jgi:hypothetical protein